MAGASVRIEGADAALAALAGIVSRLAAPKPMWDDIGQSLTTSTQNRFERETGPDGSRWPQSIRARLTGGRTLRDTNRLWGSITHQADDGGVMVGTNTLYAAIHQFGGRIEAKTAKGLRFKIAGKYVSKKSVTIPARPFLGLDDADLEEIQNIAKDWVLREASGAA